MASANMQAHRTAGRMWELEAASYQKAMLDNYRGRLCQDFKKENLVCQRPGDLGFYLAMTGKPLKGF